MLCREVFLEKGDIMSWITQAVVAVTNLVKALEPHNTVPSGALAVLAIAIHGVTTPNVVKTLGATGTILLVGMVAMTLVVICIVTVVMDKKLPPRRKLPRPTR